MKWEYITKHWISVLLSEFTNSNTMAKLFHPYLSILFFTVSLSNLVFAQLTSQQCATGATNAHDSVYHAILNKPGSDPMKWCPLWAAVCNFVYLTCPTVTCEFTNYDSRITTRYDPSTASYISFLRCTSCNVEGECFLVLYNYGLWYSNATQHPSICPIIALWSRKYVFPVVLRLRTFPSPQMILILIRLV